MPRITPPTPEPYVVILQTACCIKCGRIIVRTSHLSWTHAATAREPCRADDRVEHEASQRLRRGRRAPRA